MSDNSIIKKVKALLQKTTSNGATEQEAIAALQMAAKLMKKHNIEQADLNKFSGLELCEISEDCTLSKPLKAIILPQIADLFDCKASSNKYVTNFYGFKEDIELSFYTYNMLKKTCEAELKKFRKTDDYKQRVKIYGNGEGRTLSNSFRYGFFVRAAIRIKDMYEARSQEVEQERSYAIVMVSKVEKVKNGYEDIAKNRATYSMPTKFNLTSLGYEKGSEAGDKAKLHQAIY